MSQTVIHGKIESPWNTIELTGRCEFGVSISIVPEVTESRPGKDAQQRGLAAAARPHDHEELAMSDVDRHAVDGGELPEWLEEVADADGRGQRFGGIELGERKRHAKSLRGSICRGEAPFTTCYFAPMGRGAASTGAVCVETNFLPRIRDHWAGLATARCKGTGAAHGFQFRRAY